MSEAWDNWKKAQGDSKPWHILNVDARIKDQTKIDARLNICRGCPELIQLTTTCKKCGCFMSVKTGLLGAECPIGKWGKETNE